MTPTIQNLNFLLLLLLLLLLLNTCSSLSLPMLFRRSRVRGMNAVDRCWRGNRRWASDRQKLAMCSVGFAGKMKANVGRGLKRYTVTNPGDDPAHPRPGTLRYGATVVRGKVWIEFRGDMVIKLRAPLLVKSYTAIDGRGAKVEIANGAGFMLEEVSNVIIHGLHFHHCSPRPSNAVVVPGGKAEPQHDEDGDAIRMVGCRKVWIDHNTFYQSHDGLVDVTRGSTDITVSNSWFRDHNKVMLLGHDDGFVEDRRMRVTVAFNRFGPDANQRMPRVRHGYAHVVNNLYDGWGNYAIGGSMNPSIRSEANLFVASKAGKKKVTWREGSAGEAKSWNWRSVGDAFANGAFFKQSGGGGGGGGAAPPAYNQDQKFAVGRASSVRLLTRDAGALDCSTRSRC